MSDNRRVSRRGFVRKAARMLAAPIIIPSSVLGRDSATAPSERVTIGCIGVGGRGTHDMRRLMRYDGQVVAVCDVKQNVRERARELTNIPAQWVYADFRELLARDDIDAVLVATPDHWHVLIGIAAIKAGKDLYLEKPLGMSIDEGKAMRKAVLASDRVFMHGTEQRAMPEVRKMCELVRNGRIGELKTVTVACPGGQELGPPVEAPVPEGFDYEMWLGPAPKRPYATKRCQQPSFFFISDYAASGYINGWGVHHIDVAQWAMGTDDTGPVEVEGKGTFPKPGDLADTPLTWRIEYKYKNGVRMIFTDVSQNPEGVRFEGSEGWLFKAYNNPTQASDPKIIKSKIGPNDVHLYETDADEHCFIECCKSRKETCSPIEAAHRSTTIGYLGHIAIVAGRKLEWDPKAERFVNDDEANKLLTRPMREPWTL